MQPTIKLAFCDFWGGFDARDNYFTRLLAPHYDLQLDDDPDFVICSCFGKGRRAFRCPRIFFTGECVRPDFRDCEFAFTFDFCDRAEHHRLPLYALYGDPQWLVKEAVDPERVLAEKSGFCSFVYSNPACKARVRFFEKLSRYKRVDAGGRLLNNVGGPVANKFAFARRYKFAIACENESYPGYTTEKIVEAMHARSVPLYWGNPLVHLDFNPASFVNHSDCGSLDEMVERVVELDRDDAKYCAMLREPWYHGNRVNEYVDPANVLAQFARIFGEQGALPARGCVRSSGRAA